MMHLTTPVFIVMQENASAQLSPIPAPSAPPCVEEPACPIVLQANFPEGQIDPNQSMARFIPGKVIPLVAYNFSDKPAHVSLTADLPANVTSDLPAAIELAPQQRLEIPMTLTMPSGSNGQATIRIHGDLADHGRAMLSFNRCLVRRSQQPQSRKRFEPFR